MPRKTRSRREAPRRRRRGFNEAAARCRGKPRRLLVTPPGLLSASMRPRPDAAENLAVALRIIGAETASMRPRPDAAENLRREVDGFFGTETLQ